GGAAGLPRSLRNRLGLPRAAGGGPGRARRAAGSAARRGGGSLRGAARLPAGPGELRTRRGAVPRAHATLFPVPPRRPPDLGGDGGDAGQPAATARGGGVMFWRTLVEAEELADQLDSPELVVVDCRF